MKMNKAVDIYIRTMTRFFFSSVPHRKKQAKEKRFLFGLCVHRRALNR